jgi:hypothetical protein
MLDNAIQPDLHHIWNTPCFGKLNVLEWSHHFTVTCFGVRICVRANDAGLLERLRERLPVHVRPYSGPVVDHFLSAIRGGPVEGTRIRRFNILYRNHEVMVRSRDIEKVLESFDSSFQQVVALLSPRRIFVHAGAVGWKGRVIIIPGRTLSGKTSLVAELVRAGASYLSDEFAILDEKGRVHPYLKPLSIRADSLSRQIDTPVEEIGGKAAKDPLPAGLVVISGYRPGATWRPRTLTQGRAALEILANTINGRFVPDRAISAIRRVIAEAPVVKSSRGEAAEVAPRLLELLERRAGL